MGNKTSGTTIVGDYGFATIQIIDDGKILHGKWTGNSMRPDFVGQLSSDGRTGWMAFPDDRIYKLEFEQKSQQIFWDGRNSGNVWKRQADLATAQSPAPPEYQPGDGENNNDDDNVQYDHRIAGDYTAAVITCEGSALHGRWAEDYHRPDFEGEFKSSNSGFMVFPDDKKYTFEYSASSERIYWDGRDSGNVWNKKKPKSTNALEYEQVGGIYPAAEIIQNGNELIGRWNKEHHRPEFKGELETENTGYMRFPDDRKYSLEYEKSTGKIYWDGRQSGNVWVKKVPKSAAQMGGLYKDQAGAQISIDQDGSALHGKWKGGGRIDFDGQLNSLKEGYMVFPDDRKYTFEFEESSGTIYWDGRSSGNRWFRQEPTTSSTASTGSTSASSVGIAGSYASANISVSSDGQITGKWTNRNRVDFAGEHTGANTGWVLFPDDRKYTFEYEESTGRIYWDGRHSGNIWTKKTVSK